MASCKVRSVPFQGMFQRAIVVDPLLREDYLGQDKWVQETLVGYKYGSYTKLGFICERTPEADYPKTSTDRDEGMEVDETSQGPVDAKASKLDEFNMVAFLKAVKRQGEKPMKD